MCTLGFNNARNQCGIARLNSDIATVGTCRCGTGARIKGSIAHRLEYNATVSITRSRIGTYNAALLHCPTVDADISPDQAAYVKRLIISGIDFDLQVRTRKIYQICASACGQNNGSTWRFNNATIDNIRGYQRYQTTGKNFDVTLIDDTTGTGRGIKVQLSFEEVVVCHAKGGNCQPSDINL